METSSLFFEAFFFDSYRRVDRTSWAELRPHGGEIIGAPLALEWDTVKEAHCELRVSVMRRTRREEG